MGQPQGPMRDARQPRGPTTDIRQPPESMADSFDMDPHLGDDDYIMSSDVAESSTSHIQPTTTHHPQPSTTHPQPSTTHSQPSITHRQPLTNYIQPSPLPSLPAPAITFQPKRVSDEVLDALFRKHFPDTASPAFKSPQQREAVRLAVEGKRSFVAVLPTGGEKSLTFTLPAFNPKEAGFQSFIIVPNHALLDDHIERSERLGLNVSWWTAKNKEIKKEDQLVFLAMESAASESFKKYVFFLM